LWILRDLPSRNVPLPHVPMTKTKQHSSQTRGSAPRAVWPHRRRPPTKTNGNKE
jgi:hypothetical protein